MTPSTRCSGSFGLASMCGSVWKVRLSEVARHQEVAREGRAGLAEGYRRAGSRGLGPRVARSTRGRRRVRSGDPAGHLRRAGVHALGHEPRAPREERPAWAKQVDRLRAEERDDGRSEPAGPSSSSAAAGMATVTESSVARPRAACHDGRGGVIVLLVVRPPSGGPELLRIRCRELRPSEPGR